MEAGSSRFGGPEGNEMLTMATAAVLVVLLLAVGVTVIDMGGLEHVHMILGLLLIPPVLLKMASTGYRFARYYLRSRPYRLKGPPQLPMRLLAPVLVVATVGVFATGVVLLADGHKVGWLLELHKITFIVWGVVFGIHFLVYAPRVARLLVQDWRSPPGAGLRVLTVATAVALGGALVALLLPAIDSWHA
jgi:hypothetical protein